jgi:signal transduction histidine kinase
MAMITDITERKRLERKMARLERLNVAGEMAAGIAHEIRNPLSSARGLLQLAGLREKGECTWYRKYADLIIKELDRTNELVTQFLFLAREKSVNRTSQNLNTIIKELIPLIAADAAGLGQEVNSNLKNVPDLSLDENEIRQLIVNLSRNGLQAMKSGGVLTIKTYPEADTVVLAVQDQGPGIPDDALDKLGTPFFTTKKQGTGLGLAICYRIADRHNAVITVQTGPGGSTFYVKFKAA